MRIILYSKPGCHLCEGLQEKLEQIQSPKFDLEIRDITSQQDWFQAYQYEIPVMFLQTEPEQDANSSEQVTPLIPLPRPSPRASVQQIAQMLQKHLP